jgi:hypothetical protein
MENEAAGDAGYASSGIRFMLVGELRKATGWMRYAGWLGYSPTQCDHKMPSARPTQPLAAQRHIQIAAFDAPIPLLPYML